MTDENHSLSGINPHLTRPYDWSPKAHRQVELSIEESLVPNLTSLEGMVLFAKYCYQFYTDRKPPKGLPDMWVPWGHKGRNADDLQALIPQLSDKVIRELCQSLVIQAKVVDDINEQWGQLLAAFVGLPTPQTKADFQRLRQKLDKYRQRKEPAWTTRSEFQQLAAKSQQVIFDTEQLWLQLHARLEQLYARLIITSEDFGDQRAKDLIDKVEGEPDPRRAIRVLKQALRYGDKGIQASKAYSDIGNRYADMGDIVQAIENYTKSIEAWREPNPMTLYWRGELYYQQNQREEARSDFEKALSLGLFSPEQEQAREYLSKLNTTDPVSTP